MKKLLLLFALLSSVLIVCAQELTITGTVKDSKGDPIPNINVNESGKNLNVQTNGDGNYKITASRNSTLVFRGIGYTTQNIKVTSNTINVSLVESTTDLDAVTVVGYSAKKKSELSSAVSVVSGEKLNDVTSVNLATLIQGKVPGVVASTASGDPTSGASIVIRGAGTINASTGPLYVVDGNIGGSYNPADVETITVLRDAAATGLYGSRAANGVIIVTTKKGKNGETKFNLSSVIGFANPTMGNFSLMNAQELFNYQSTFFTPAAGVLNNDTDWWDLGFRTGMINNHTLTASGGS
ncbi:TonB-dependent receptor plug domain-containing protein [Pedobacter sp.]|uniref:TonB-dependent receptor plug domain-containing protein n=1 Tax=Pedobacter sp. TaxID=1411316 RepID=UPI003BAA35D6